jgi:GNAT superfamily N-acetyltransferase
MHATPIARCSIRPAAIGDAVSIAEMAREFNSYLLALGDKAFFQLDTDRIRRDGFGRDPAFQALIAERDEMPLGYLLHHQGYDSDRAERFVMICDLYVREEARGQGAGRALMSAAMAHCRAIGGYGLLWSVFKLNTAAAAFYRRLGAQSIDDLDFMYLDA